jgi:hypothetical protein
MKRHPEAVLLLPLFAIALLAAQQTTGAPKVADPKSPTLPAPNSMTAYDPFFSEGRGYWERDYLVYVDPRSPRVDLYDKDKNVASVKVTTPGYSDFSLSEGTVTPDGHLVISGCSHADEGGKIHCFIGLTSRDGHVLPLIDTGRFAPMKISICDGATVWAMGWLRAPPYFDRESDEPYDVLRLYRLKDGKIVESALPRSSFPARSNPSSPGGFESPELTMQCRGTTLGIYEGASDEWIEYDTANSKLARWKLLPQTHHFAQYDSSGNILPFPVHPTFITGLAMLDSGDVYASFVREARDGSVKATVGLFRLEKAVAQSTWSLVDGTLGAYGEQGKFDELCGTDGKNLVYSRFGEHHWFFSARPH